MPRVEQQGTENLPLLAGEAHAQVAPNFVRARHHGPVLHLCDLGTFEQFANREQRGDFRIAQARHREQRFRRARQHAEHTAEAVEQGV